MRIRKHPRVRARVSKVLIGQMLLIHALYYGGSIAILQAKSLLFEVVPQTVYRSGQPSIPRLERWIQQYDLKTVVNLRGTNYPLYTQEKTAAEAMGVQMQYVDISAYRLIRHDRLCQLIDVIENAEKPMLIHCNHGVDRSGIASALAAWLVGGIPYRSAKFWSYVPPGPWKYRPKISPHHVSETFTVYEEYCAKQGLDPDDPARFKHWAAHIYQHVESNYQTP